MLAECLPDDGSALFAIFGEWRHVWGCGVSTFSLFSESTVAQGGPGRRLVILCLRLGNRTGPRPTSPGDPIALLV